MADLSFGYKTITNGARGFWDTLNANIQRTNDHDHEGTNSKKLAPTAITKNIQTLLSASWIATTGGFYQNVTLPSGYTFTGGLSVKFYAVGGSDDGSEIAITPQKLTDTTMRIEINDNTIGLKAVYA